MKKSLLAIACFAVASVSAMAQITVLNGETVVGAGDIVTFEAEPELVLTPALTLPPEWGGQDPYFVNESGEDGTLAVTVSKVGPLKEVDKTSSFTWCGITTQCEPMNNYSETRSCTLSAGAKAPLALHCTFTAGTYETRDAEVTFSWNGQKVASFTVRFTYTDPSSIQQISDDSGVRVHFDGTQLQYAFDRSAAGQTRVLQVFNSEGRLAMLMPLEGEGAVSLGSLPHGTYIYSVVCGGRRVVTRKIMTN